MQALKTRWRERFRRWIEARIPLSPSVTLNQSRIFIVPTRQGLVLLIVVALVLLMAINFESALNYALAFWLVAILWVTVHLTYRNLSGLKLTAGDGNLVCVNDWAQVTIRLSSEKSVNRGTLELIHESWGVRSVDMRAQEATIRLPVLARRRGPVQPPRFRIESRFPFGLVVAWSHVHLDAKAWAYPTGLPYLRQTTGADVDDDDAVPDDHFVQQGSEDFHSLRAYVPGDPVNRLHWPGFSRDVLMVKSFSDYQGRDEWVDWAQFTGDAEQKLGGMAYEIQRHVEQDQPFGMRLPEWQMEPSKGLEHLQKARRALAEFGFEHN